MTQDPNVFTSFIFTWHHICVVDDGLNAHITKVRLNVVSPKASLLLSLVRACTLAQNKMKNMWFYARDFSNVCMHGY